MQVNIISCRDLPELIIAPDGQCLLEPYVKLQLLPEKQHRVKTRLVRASRNPRYDEIFSMYGLDKSQLPTTSLHFAVRKLSLTYMLRSAEYIEDLIGLNSLLKFMYQPYFDFLIIFRTNNFAMYSCQKYFKSICKF